VRVLILAVFVLAFGATGAIVVGSGVLTQTARSAGLPASAPQDRVIALAWPSRGLRLGATAGGVVWEQRSADPSVSGLWRYDPRTGVADHLLARSELGRTAGWLAAFGSTVTWTCRTRHGGAAQVRCFDTETRRCFTATSHGTSPAGSGRTIVWVEARGPRAGRGTVVACLDLVTDLRFDLRADGPVREVATSGRWVIWLARGAICAASATSSRSQLATRATALAADAQHVVWAARVGGGRTAIVVWDPGRQSSRELCRVHGTVTALALSERLVAWTQGSDGGVGACDLGNGRRWVVGDAAAPGIGPVVVSRTVFWAERRGGSWELCRRSL
jgi:hypothetical protein